VIAFSSVTATLNGTTLNVLAQTNLSGCPSGNGAFTLNLSATH
jgi:hypothetical protein